MAPSAQEWKEAVPLLGPRKVLYHDLARLKMSGRPPSIRRRSNAEEAVWHMQTKLQVTHALLSLQGKGKGKGPPSTDSAGDAPPSPGDAPRAPAAPPRWPSARHLLGPDHPTSAKSSFIATHGSFTRALVRGFARRASAASGTASDAGPPAADSARRYRVALDGKGPQRRPQKPLDRRLEDVVEAVGGGCCRLQMLLRLAFGVRGTLAGHRLGAVESVWGGGGGCLHPFQCIPAQVRARGGAAPRGGLRRGPAPDRAAPAPKPEPVLPGPGPAAVAAEHRGETGRRPAPNRRPELHWGAAGEPPARPAGAAGAGRAGRAPRSEGRGDLPVDQAPWREEGDGDDDAAQVCVGRCVRIYAICDFYRPVQGLCDRPHGGRHTVGGGSAWLEHKFLEVVGPTPWRHCRWHSLRRGGSGRQSGARCLADSTPAIAKLLCPSPGEGPRPPNVFLRGQKWSKISEKAVFQNAS